ncbi:MAG: hypothetical protein HFJ54_08400 [Clostridia bacterium]|nr:hypothetical protein [Clostridia bacterium]
MSDIEPTTGETYDQLSGNESQTDTTFTTEKLDWRIWNIDEDYDKVVLIADDVTSTNVELRGFIGYNNGVGILNQIGKTCYSNSKIGAIGKSISWAELEAVMINPPESTTRFKITGTKLYYPLMHQYEEYSGIDENLVGKGQQAMAGYGTVTRSDQPWYIATNKTSGYANARSLIKNG